MLLCAGYLYKSDLKSSPKPSKSIGYETVLSSNLRRLSSRYLCIDFFLLRLLLVSLPWTLNHSVVFMAVLVKWTHRNSAIKHDIQVPICPVNIHVFLFSPAFHKPVTFIAFHRFLAVTGPKSPLAMGNLCSRCTSPIHDTPGAGCEVTITDFCPVSCSCMVIVRNLVDGSFWYMWAYTGCCDWSLLSSA